MGNLPEGLGPTDEKLPEPCNRCDHLIENINKFGDFYCRELDMKMDELVETCVHFKPKENPKTELTCSSELLNKLDDKGVEMETVLQNEPERSKEICQTVAERMKTEEFLIGKDLRIIFDEKGVEIECFDDNDSLIIGTRLSHEEFSEMIRKYKKWEEMRK